MRMKRTARLNNRGVTLAETLIVVLIMSIITAAAVSGVAAAVRSYQNAVDAANAQVLLSTTMARLRDELGKAKKADVEDTTVTYTTEYDNVARIYLKSEENKDTVIMIQEYPGTDTNEEASERQLVSAAASTDTLYIIYESVTALGGVVEFKNLKVKNEKHAVLASAEKYIIRTMADLFR